MRKDQIISCIDKDSIEIVCNANTWYNHIVAGHPEMEGCESHVKTAIGNPYQIYQDKSNLNRRIIYEPFILPKPFNTQFLRVVIEYKRKWGHLRGYIITAFACVNRKEGDILIWQRS